MQHTFSFRFFFSFIKVSDINQFHLSFSILRYPGHALTHDCTHLHLSGLEAHLFIPALASVTERQAHAIKQTYI